VVFANGPVANVKEVELDPGGELYLLNIGNRAVRKHHSNVGYL